MLNILRLNLKGDSLSQKRLNFVLKNYINIKRPVNITTPITLALAGSLVGNVTIANGNRLNIQAHLGKLVIPVTTAIKKAIENTNMARYPVYIV